MTTLLPSLGLVFGPTEILLVLVVLVLIFGATKIPMLARGLGAGIRNFKGELARPKDPDGEDEPEG